MLDEYQKTQPIVYKILKNAVSKEKYSHAYLFETNGFSGSYNLVISFIKQILCPSHNQNNCGECHQCEVIDSGNFPEIEIISPDGMWIKKEQLQKLQNEFNKKAVIGNKKIYIIKQADKLNKQAANSILKFLEEPEEGIIAILITDNFYQVLETIRSRCQIISLKPTKPELNNETTINKLHITYYGNEIKDETTEKLNRIIKFINAYEKHHINTILYMQKLWHDYIKSKEDYLIAFDIMTLYYKDILNYLTNRELEYFNDYQEEINQIAQTNNLEDICKKLTSLTDFKEKIKYNANTNLLMDKLIIEMEGGIS